ncbi:MAG: hypothetical protein M0R32_09200 [Candidatus Cloacimonetes bacterium]|jgi:hypothetical protein|nr:hypothetical protein [Candidatus Cloacimonadota bacterium]
MGRKAQHVPWIELESIKTKTVPVVDTLAKKSVLKRKLEIASGALASFACNGDAQTKSIALNALNRIGEINKRNKKMRAKERIERGVRQVQLLLPEDQHRRLKVYAAMNGMTIGDVLISRILDIVEEPKEIVSSSLESEKIPNSSYPFSGTTKILFEMGEALKELLLNTRLPLDIINKRLGEVIIPANTIINDKMFEKIMLSFDCLEIDPSPIQQKISSIIDPCLEKLKQEENETLKHVFAKLDA